MLSRDVSDTKESHSRVGLNIKSSLHQVWWQINFVFFNIDNRWTTSSDMTFEFWPTNPSDLYRMLYEPHNIHFHLNNFTIFLYIISFLLSNFTWGNFFEVNIKNIVTCKYNAASFHAALHTIHQSIHQNRSVIHFCHKAQITITPCSYPWRRCNFTLG